MSSPLRALPLIVALAVTGSGCTRSAAYRGVVVGGGMVLGGALIFNRTDDLGTALGGVAISGGGLVVVLASCVAIALTDEEDDRPAPGPALTAAEQQAADAAQRACLARRLAIQRSALALGDLEERGALLRTLPRCGPRT